jgi:hypothetical protein
LRVVRTDGTGRSQVSTLWHGDTRDGWETNYRIKNPPRHTGLDKYVDNSAKAGDWTGSVKEWKSIKGYSGDYDGDSLRREAIPRAYLDYLIRPLLTNESDQNVG